MIIWLPLSSVSKGYNDDEIPAIFEKIREAKKASYSGPFCCFWANQSMSVRISRCLASEQKEETHTQQQKGGEDERPEEEEKEGDKETNDHEETLEVEEI